MYPLIKEGQLSHKYAIASPVEPMNLLSKVLTNRCQNIDPPYRKMVSYPLIEKGQQSHEYAFLRASGATLLRLGASLKRVNGAIILENGLVPPCYILLQYMGIWTFCNYDIKMKSYIKISHEFEFRT